MLQAIRWVPNISLSDCILPTAMTIPDNDLSLSYLNTLLIKTLRRS